MDVGQKVKAWRYLEAMLERVKDPLLRNAMRLEFMQRARNEWGFCPTDTQLYKEEEAVPELNEAEQAVLDRINAYLEYGVDIRTKEEKERLEAQTLNNMVEFIDSGGTYWDIPEDIRCDHLKEIYDKAFEIAFAPKICQEIA